MIKFFIIIFAFCNLLNAQSLQPGLWKVKSEIKLNGIVLPSESDEDCISADEAKDAKTTVAKELKRNNCQIKSWIVKGKNLTASIACDGSEIQADGVLKGTFTEKSYNLAGEAKGTYQNLIPSIAKIRLDGSWIKACK